jgi:hypothetical protein
VEDDLEEPVELILDGPVGAHGPREAGQSNEREIV